MYCLAVGSVLFESVAYVYLNLIKCFDSRALFTWVLPKFNEDTFNTDLFVNDVVFCRVFTGIGYRL